MQEHDNDITLYNFYKIASERLLTKTALSEVELEELNSLEERGLIEKDIAEDIRNSVYDSELLEFLKAAAQVRKEEWQKVKAGLNPGNRRSINMARNRMIIIGLSVAASVLFVVGLVELAVLNRNRPGPGVKNMTNNGVASKEIPPAVKGATLKLADGRVVAMDSVGVGSIATQGDNSVTKSKDGTVAYEHSIKHGFNTLFNTLTTDRGQTFKVDLPDGSKVWLNAGSRLTYFAQLGQKDSMRQVDLQGEAFFQIAPMKSVPFIVNTPGTRTAVLGTEFNVTAYEDEPGVIVTLLRGSVKVSNEKVSRLLKPGQQITSGPGTDASVIEADTAQVISWREGYFQFNAPLDQVMRELSRWYNVDLVLNGDFHDMVTARESREVPLSHVLRKLEEIGAAHFKLVDRKIIISK